MRENEPGQPAAHAERLRERFTALHGHPPVAVARAPGRVNLIGEHVDYNGGRCLPIALPHAAYAAASPRTDDLVRVRSLQQDDPWSAPLDRTGPGHVEGWPAYVAGVVWALGEAGHRLPGLDLVIDSTVPLGAGLSSSAALECATALAVLEAVGEPLDEARRHALVEVCVRAETEVAGAPTGGMDQSASLLATAGHALLLDCRDGSTAQVPWRPAGEDLTLLVIDTRASHSLTDGGYAARRDDCETAARTLGVDLLRDVTDPEAALADLTDARVRRRARHVLSEMRRTDQAVEALRSDDWAALGALLDASHDSLRDDFEVSCPELDAVVEEARSHGAAGARMTGGGFGGSAIALMPRARVTGVLDAVRERFGREGWDEPRWLPGDAAAGAGLV